MTKVRNRPCPLGIETGKNLAKFADHAEQQWRESMGFVPARCGSCAFKEGTYPNGCLTTVADAMKCTMERRPFYCHHDVNLKRPDEKQPHSICAGWLLLHSAEPPVKAPWKFADEYAPDRATGTRLAADGASPVMK